VCPHLLAARRALGLGLDLVGLDDHESFIHRAGLIPGYRASRLTPGEAGGDPLGTGLLPLGTGCLRVIPRRVVIDQPGEGLGVGDGGAEGGQLGLGGAVQDGAGALTLRADQLLALLMHDVDDRAEPQQVLIPGVAADLGTARARGSIAELITDRIPEVPGDVQLVGCLPGPGRGDLDGAVVLVADPRPLDGDLAKGRLEGEWPRPPALDTGAGFAAAVLQDQLLVGLLDEGSEEPALDLKAGLMDERLDLVGQVLVLGRHGQGHPQRQLQREGPIVPVDGAEVDGSLKAVGGTHGVSPYRSYEGPSCVLFYRSGRESRYPGAESLGKPTSYLVHPASRRAPTRER
jgi:hypothetical protein